MRTATHSKEIAELAVEYRDRGVVGFDIAGAEAGFPPTRHLDAFEYLRRENAHFTIHAGEAFGLPSIWEAIQWCGADRLGHGVRIVDDIDMSDPHEPQLGGLACLRPRPTDSTGVVSIQQCANRSRRIHRGTSDRVATSTQLPSDPEHGQPFDVGHIHVS